MLYRSSKGVSVKSNASLLFSRKTFFNFFLFLKNADCFGAGSPTLVLKDTLDTIGHMVHHSIRDQAEEKVDIFRPQKEEVKKKSKRGSKSGRSKSGRRRSSGATGPKSGKKRRSDRFKKRVATKGADVVMSPLSGCDGFDEDESTFGSATKSGKRRSRRIHKNQKRTLSFDEDDDDDDEESPLKTNGSHCEQMDVDEEETETDNDQSHESTYEDSDGGKQKEQNSADAHLEDSKRSFMKGGWDPIAEEEMSSPWEIDEVAFLKKHEDVENADQMKSLYVKALERKYLPYPSKFRGDMQAKGKSGSAKKSTPSSMWNGYEYSDLAKDIIEYRLAPYYTHCKKRWSNWVKKKKKGNRRPPPEVVSFDDFLKHIRDATEDGARLGRPWLTKMHAISNNPQRKKFHYIGMFSISLTPPPRSRCLSHQHTSLLHRRRISGIRKICQENSHFSTQFQRQIRFRHGNHLSRMERCRKIAYYHLCFSHARNSASANRLVIFHNGNLCQR